MSRFTLFRPRKSNLPGWLYRISLILFIIIFIALLVATPIDIIHQSRTSGQFWDAIIVVIAYVLAVVIIVILYLIRLIQVRTSLSDIPRRYMTRKDDVSERCASRIRNEFNRCSNIIQQTLPKSEDISHPGMRNPDLSEGFIDNISYEEIADACGLTIEIKAKSLHPSFVRPRGMPLREYLLLLESYNLLDWTDEADKFLSLHERVRFSEKLMTEDDFNEYIESTFQVLYSIKVPEDNDYTSSQAPSHGHQSFIDQLLNLKAISSIQGGRLRENGYPNTSTANASPVLSGWEFHQSGAHSRESSTQISPFNGSHSPHYSRYYSTGLYPLHSLSQMSTRLLSPSRTNGTVRSDNESDASVIIHRV